MVNFFSASGADYNPFQNPLISQWVRDCYNGDLRAIKSQVATDPTLLEKRESVLRLSGLFHVISGARTINPTRFVQDEIRAKRSKDMGKNNAHLNFRHTGGFKIRKGQISNSPYEHNFS